MSGCPSSTAGGCRCPEHHPGLSAYAADQAAYQGALAPCRGPVRLSVVTAGPSAEHPCTGGMTCSCPSCVGERADVVRRGAQGAGNADPFRRVAA